MHNTIKNIHNFLFHGVVRVIDSLDSCG